MKYRNFAGLFLMLLLFTINSAAQSEAQGELLTLGLENMDYPIDSSRMKMISAVRISKSLDELPLQVIVITEDEILRNQYTTLSDVLLALPGVVVSRPGTGELGETFEVWNLTGNLYTKVLINGVPVKPSVVAGMPIGSQLPVRQAERIEIIYGNASSIYGADAVSGVINIVTKEADRGSFVRGDISLGAGGQNYINFTVGGKGGKNDNILQYSFYGSKYEVSDMHLDYSEDSLYNPLNYYIGQGTEMIVGSDTVEASEIDAGLLARQGISQEDFKRTYYGQQYEGTLTMPAMQALGSEAHMLGMQLKYKGVWLSYNYMYRRTHSSLGLSPAFFKYNNPQNFWGESIQQFSLNYTKEFGKVTSTTQLSSLAYQMDNNSNQSLSRNYYTEKVYRYSASNDIEFSQVFSGNVKGKLELVGGLSYQYSGNLPTTNYLYTPFDKSHYKPFASEVSSEYTSPYGQFGINPIRFKNFSVFSQFYTTWKKFGFLGGLRNDVNDLYHTSILSPHLALLHYTSERTTLRFSAGTAYKAPPTSLSYQSLAFPITDSMTYVIAYTDNSLRPEKFSTFEIGFTTRFSSRFTLEQTFFTYRITNHLMPNYLFKAAIIDSSSDLDIEDIYNSEVGLWNNFSASVSTVGGSQTTLRFTNIVPSIKLNAEVHLYIQGRKDRLLNVHNLVEDYLTLAPNHTGKLKVSMQPTENFYLYVESHWMSKWLRILIPFEDLYTELFGPATGYYAMNAVANFSLSNQLNIFVKATNIFDERYGIANPAMLEPSLIYNPQLRRTVRFGLSYKMN